MISRKTAAVRRESARAQMQRARLAFEFFDAIDEPNRARRCFSGIDARLFRLNTRRDPAPGEIGCYASHLSLWRKCIESREPIVVLEDDFALRETFPAALRRLETLTATFGFIRLENYDRHRVMTKRLRPATHEVLRAGGMSLHYVSDVPLSMLAYAVNPRTAASLVRASRILFAPVDKFMQQTWVHSARVFALAPASVELSHHHESSTIGDRPVKMMHPGLLIRRLLYKARGEIGRARFDKPYLRHIERLRHAGPAPVLRDAAGRTVDAFYSSAKQ